MKRNRKEDDFVERESSTLEYKEDMTNTFLKTVSAFANYQDGKIIFGVRDDGTVKGIPQAVQKCLDIENKINDSISPQPDYMLKINEDNQTIVLTVKKGDNPPYLYKNKAYRRSDSASLEVDRVALNRLILEGSHRYYEDLPAGTAPLTFSVLAREMKKQLGVSQVNTDVLKTLGFYTAEGKSTHVAELFSDQNPFPGVDMMIFGRSINEIRERIKIQGCSVLSLFHQAVERIAREYQVEKIDGVERRMVEKIPSQAIREALANALVHRTWDIPTAIRVAMYPDKVEITSPGGLPAGISQEEYLHHQISILRNPKLANVFYRLGYIEAFGTGIQRILYAYRQSRVKPDFQVTEHIIQVTLPLVDGMPPLDQEEQQVCAVFPENGLLSRQEIEQATGFEKTKVIRLLNRLVGKKAVLKVGKGRGTRYQRQ
ncbi:putative DNA binding domain-containing protein [Acidaminococcus fermentans DSM 20731]|uniref:ATP-binding protein n=1 Tax=Acidaminococcus fermentans TaxID=905 RepID=UPI0006743350|nr:ATP-binding protein [Acidaminococcus fermentans]UEA72501.1 putative DNA binding domain-containing protein [Acidaminococcus fermentans DSM 20731]